MDPLTSLLLACSQLGAFVANVTSSQSALLHKAFASYFNYYLALKDACAWGRELEAFREAALRADEGAEDLLSSRPPGFQRMLELSEFVEELKVNLKLLNFTLSSFQSSLKELESLQLYRCAGRPEGPYLRVLCALSDLATRVLSYGSEAASSVGEELRALSQDLNYLQSVLNGCRLVAG